MAMRRNSPVVVGLFGVACSDLDSIEDGCRFWVSVLMAILVGGKSMVSRQRMH